MVGHVLQSSCGLALQQFQDLLSSSEAWHCQLGKSRSVASSGFSGPPLSLNLWVPTVAIVDSTCLGAPTLGVSDKRVAKLMLGDVVIQGQAIVFTTCSGLATRKLHHLPTCLGRVCAFFSCPDYPTNHWQSCGYSVLGGRVLSSNNTDFCNEYCTL